MSEEQVVHYMNKLLQDEYKLTKFYGITSGGSVREECSGFVEKDEKIC